MRSRRTVIDHAVDAASLVAVLVMLLAAVEPWTLIFESGASAVLVIRASVASTWIVVILTARVLGWKRRDAAIASLTAATFSTVAIMVSTWDATVLPTLGSSVINGLPQILSTALPIATSPAVIGSAVIILWAGSCTASVLATEQRSVVAVLSVVLVVFGVGIAVVAGAVSDLEHRLTTPAMVLLGAFAAYAFVRSAATLRFMTRRTLLARAVTGVALVAAAWWTGTIGATAIPFGASEPVGVRFEPATVRQTPPEPISMMRSLRVDPTHAGSVATLAGPSLVDWHGFLSVATYPPSAYQDGQRWAARTRFVPSGGIRPVGDVGARSDRAWAMRVELPAARALDGWLPHPSPVIAVDGLRISTNQQGLIASDPTDCDPTCTFNVRTDPLPTIDQVLEEGRRIGEGFLWWRPEAAGGERSPGRQVCEVLQARLQRRAAPEPFDCDEAVEPSVGFVEDLRSFVRDGRRVEEIDGDGPRLAATDQLQPVLELVGAPREANPAGDPSQFATAYALLADHFGIDARFVTGFRLCPAPDVGNPALCITSNTTTVLAEHSWSWVEINLPDIGWIIVDPSPRAVVDEEQELAAGAAGRQRDGPREDPERIEARPDPSDVPRQLAPSTPPNPLFAPAILAALIVLVPIPATVTRGRRRVARRSGRPDLRTVGAFHELVDALFDAGRPDIEGRSAVELAHEAQALVGEQVRDVARLGLVANHAMFSSRGIPAAMADEAWTIARRTARTVRRQAPLRYRIRAAIRPAPSALTHRQRVFAASDELRRASAAPATTRLPIPRSRRVEGRHDTAWHGPPRRPAASAIRSEHRLDLTVDRVRDRRAGFFGPRSSGTGEP